MALSCRKAGEKENRGSFFLLYRRSIKLRRIKRRLHFQYRLTRDLIRTRAAVDPYSHVKQMN